jgi:hypothetical protein
MRKISTGRRFLQRAGVRLRQKAKSCAAYVLITISVGDPRATLPGPPVERVEYFPFFRYFRQSIDPVQMLLLRHFASVVCNDGGKPQSGRMNPP